MVTQAWSFRETVTQLTKYRVDSMLHPKLPCRLFIFVDCMTSYCSLIGQKCHMTSLTNERLLKVWFYLFRQIQKSTYWNSSPRGAAIKKGSVHIQWHQHQHQHQPAIHVFLSHTKLRTTVRTWVSTLHLHYKWHYICTLHFSALHVTTVVHYLTADKQSVQRFHSRHHSTRLAVCSTAYSILK